MSEVDQLKAENYRLRVEKVQQELQMIEMTIALMNLRRPLVLAELNALKEEGKKHGPASN